MEMTEERISEVEDKSLEIIQSKEQTKKKIEKKIKQNFRDLWYKNKSSNIHPSRRGEKMC